MSQTKALFEKVEEAFLRRLAADERTSADAIIPETGGSKSTVTRHLRVCVAKHAAKLKDAKPTPPPQAFAMGEDNVRRMFALFNEVMSEHNSQAAKVWQDLLSTLQACLEDRDADVTRLQAELDAANARLTDVAADRDRAIERARVAEAAAAHTTDVAALVEQLRSLTVSAVGASQAAQIQPDPSAAPPAAPTPVAPVPAEAPAKASSTKASRAKEAVTRSQKATGKPAVSRAGRGRARKTE